MTLTFNGVEKFMYSMYNKEEKIYSMHEDGMIKWTVVQLICRRANSFLVIVSKNFTNLDKLFLVCNNERRPKFYKFRRANSFSVIVSKNFTNLDKLFLVCNNERRPNFYN